MGRKRRKIIKRQPKPFPSLFLCPICNQQAVTVERNSPRIATVKCSSCGTSHEVPWYRSYMAVDAYSVWYDVVTGRRSESELRREVDKILAEQAARESAVETEAEVEETPISKQGEPLVETGGDGEGTGRADAVEEAS